MKNRKIVYVSINPENRWIAKYNERVLFQKRTLYEITEVCHKNGYDVMYMPNHI